MRFIALLTLIFFGAFTGTALAANADPSVTDAARSVFDAVMHGQWWAAAALAVVLLCAAIRKYMPASWKDGTKGDIVGTALAFVLAFSMAVATVMVAPGAAMSAGVALTALKIGVAAIGGYNVLHKIATWLVAWGKLPSWAMPIIGLLTTLIGSNAISKAEALGNKAVVAKPATGLPGDEKVTEVE